MDTIIKSIIAETQAGKFLDPLIADSIGIKNIHHYRAKYVRISNIAKLEPESHKILMQVLMSVKNRTRLIQGLKLEKDAMTDPAMKTVLSFIEKYCSNTTRDQTDMKIPTVKIPDSFPEICATLFATTCLLKGITDSETIVDEMVRKPWISSLHLSKELQEINKQAVKEMWDSWGKSSGKKKNADNEVLQFDEEIYNNSANDKILLFNANGAVVKATDEGYTKEQLVIWIDSWKAAVKSNSVTFVGSNEKKLLMP